MCCMIFPGTKARLTSLEFPRSPFCFFEKNGGSTFISLVSGDLLGAPQPPRGYRGITLHGHQPALTTLRCSPSCLLGPWIKSSTISLTSCPSTAGYFYPSPVSLSAEVWVGMAKAQAVFSTSAFCACCHVKSINISITVLVTATEQMRPQIVYFSLRNRG